MPPSRCRGPTRRHRKRNRSRPHPETSHPSTPKPRRFSGHPYAKKPRKRIWSTENRGIEDLCQHLPGPQDLQGPPMPSTRAALSGAIFRVLFSPLHSRPWSNHNVYVDRRFTMNGETLLRMFRSCGSRSRSIITTTAAATTTHHHHRHRHRRHQHQHQYSSTAAVQQEEMTGASGRGTADLRGAAGPPGPGPGPGRSSQHSAR